VPGELLNKLLNFNRLLTSRGEKMGMGKLARGGRHSGRIGCTQICFRCVTERDDVMTSTRYRRRLSSSELNNYSVELSFAEWGISKC